MHKCKITYFVLPLTVSCGCNLSVQKCIHQFFLSILVFAVLCPLLFVPVLKKKMWCSISNHLLFCILSSIAGPVKKFFLLLLSYSFFISFCDFFFFFCIQLKAEYFVCWHWFYLESLNFFFSTLSGNHWRIRHFEQHCRLSKKIFLLLLRYSFFHFFFWFFFSFFLFSFLHSVKSWIFCMLTLVLSLKSTFFL